MRKSAVLSQVAVVVVVVAVTFVVFVVYCGKEKIKSSLIYKITLLVECKS